MYQLFVPMINAMKLLLQSNFMGARVHKSFGMRGKIGE